MLNKLACLSLATAFAGFAAGPNAPELQTRANTAAPLEATAKIVEANYCFARFHALEYERLPAPPLVLQLKVQVSYRGTGTRPLILPLEHNLSVYTSRTPGLMKLSGVLGPKLKPMDYLPVNVNAKSPIDPVNDVFTIIPAGGEMSPALVEEIAVPIYKKSIRQSVDLRGRKLYLRLQLDHQPLSASLEAAMSDRWTSFGAPWTGRLRTNTLLLDVPALPDAKECVDTKDPRYPHHGLDELQGAQTK